MCGACPFAIDDQYKKSAQRFCLSQLLYGFIFVRIYSYMIESPRWLINRGKFHRAAFYLNRIAKVNGKSTQITEKLLRSMLPNEEPEKTFGILSLFSGFRLAKNTTILVVCW